MVIISLFFVLKIFPFLSEHFSCDHKLGYFKGKITVNNNIKYKFLKKIKSSLISEFYMSIQNIKCKYCCSGTKRQHEPPDAINENGRPRRSKRERLVCSLSRRGRPARTLVVAEQS